MPMELGAPMKRRDLLQLSALAGLATSVQPLAHAELGAKGDPASATAAPLPNALKPPAGRIPVAFLISDGAVVIDFAGPWEVFANVYTSGPMSHAFQLYTVAETTAPVRC